MNRTRSLEEERNAILFRIHESRDEYRKLFNGDLPPRHVKRQHRQTDIVEVPGTEVAIAPDSSFVVQHPVARWVKAHPFICMAIAAGIVAIGPRRIFRTGMRGGVALAALTRRNPQNIDVMNRLLSTVADYLQRRRMR